MKDKNSILKFYQESIYGRWRSGEEVSYHIEEIGAGSPLTVNIPWVKVPQEYTKPARKALNITVKREGKSVTFSVAVYLPENQTNGSAAPQDGTPFIVSFHPIEPLALAQKKGFAMIVFTDYCLNIAGDN
ncbi:MAG: hypothetical protein IKR64_02890, partial [Treponema sp.]|nr:hypothetical protein [Treponema sp.]